MVNRIADKHRVAAAQLGVHARDQLVLVLIAELAEVHSSAGVACFWEPGSDFYRRRRKQRRVDLVVDEWKSSPESGRRSRHADPTAGSAAFFTRDSPEVAGEHFRGGNKLETARRRGTFEGPLIAAEEEQSVPNNRSPQRPAQLVPLQRITFGCECIPRVEHLVSNEFKPAAVKCVRSRLSHHTYKACRVLPVPRRNGAGFDLELLQRIRK